MSEVVISGHVYLIEPTKVIGQKGFKKRTVVVENDNGRFANYIPVELVGDSCESADSLSVGDEVKFKCRVGGRKWQRDPSSEVKYFLSLECWDGFTSNSAPKVVKEEQEPAPAWDDSDSIPF